MKTLGIDPGTAILGYGVVEGDDPPGVGDHVPDRRADQVRSPTKMSVAFWSAVSAAFQAATAAS